MDQAEFDALTFKAFIQEVLRKAKTKKKIIMVLDNARYHHAVILKEYLMKIKDRLELFFLPPYSPDLNPIELFWRKTRRNVTHNRYFESIQIMADCLQKYWKKFLSPNKELAKLCAFI